MISTFSIFFLKFQLWKSVCEKFSTTFYSNNLKINLIPEILNKSWNCDYMEDLEELITQTQTLTLTLALTLTLTLTLTLIRP